jgi:hypothetical protein
MPVTQAFAKLAAEQSTPINRRERKSNARSGGENRRAAHRLAEHPAHGGGARVDRLADLILGYDAEVLVINEFRPDKGSALLRELDAAGYRVTYPNGVGPTLNTVLIASREPIRQLSGCSRTLRW